MRIRGMCNNLLWEYAGLAVFVRCRKCRKKSTRPVGCVLECGYCISMKASCYCKVVKFCQNKGWNGIDFALFYVFTRWFDVLYKFDTLRLCNSMVLFFFWFFIDNRFRKVLSSIQRKPHTACDWLARQDQTLSGCFFIPGVVWFFYFQERGG